MLSHRAKISFTDIGGKYHLEYASTILCKYRCHSVGGKATNASLFSVCIATVLVTAVYAIYYFGPTLRKRSPFAQQLNDAREELHARRIRNQAGGSRANSIAREHQNVRLHEAMGSRPESFVASRPGSEANSRANSRPNSRPNSVYAAEAEVEVEPKDE